MYTCMIRHSKKKKHYYFDDSSSFPLWFADYAEVEIPEAPQTVATYDVNGPRLMITHIVNENFKSYAGEQTLGPFHKVRKQENFKSYTSCTYRPMKFDDVNQMVIE